MNSEFYGYDNQEPEKPKKKFNPVLLIGIIALVFIVASILLTVILVSKSNTINPSPENPTAPSESVESDAPTEENPVDPIDPVPDIPAEPTVIDLSGIVEEVMPCIVAVTDELVVSSSYNPYSYFFGGGSSSEEERVSSGSGVIYQQKNSKLYIITNAHVVNNETQSYYENIHSKGVSVTFCDDTKVKATIQGMNVNSDLAVLAVDLNDLSEETRKAIRLANIGDSDALKVGAGALAIGNAAGYGQSVTTGIISAKNRPVTIDDITRYLLQTDAAINPGNSGGGLFDMNGKLIGINSAKTVSTNIEGMGFAIPITNAIPIIDTLINTEVLADSEKGYIGLKCESVPSLYITAYNYPSGALVTNVIAGSPGEKAGLQVYDIISAVNDIPVTSSNELTNLVNSFRAGTTVTITYYRPSGGTTFKKQTAKCTLVRSGELNAE